MKVGLYRIGWPIQVNYFRRGAEHFLHPSDGKKKNVR